MRYLLFIALATALWYLGKAVMRHYLASNSETRKNVEGNSTNQGKNHSSDKRQDIPYETARDARYRDVE